MSVGYVMDLPTLWRLASRWYEGRLVRGYLRREPAQAAAYFDEVGLRGAFWGLPDSTGHSTGRAIRSDVERLVELLLGELAARDVPALDHDLADRRRSLRAPAWRPAAASS